MAAGFVNITELNCFNDWRVGVDDWGTGPMALGRGGTVALLRVAKRRASTLDS